MSVPLALRRSLLWAVKLAVAAGLIAWVIDQAGWSRIRATLSGITLGPWLAAVGLLFLAASLSALRWWALMRAVGLGATPWRSVRLGFIGSFFNNVIPGLTGGDLVRAGWIAKDSPGLRATAVMTVMVDRVVGVVALALIGAVAVLTNRGVFGPLVLGLYGFLGLALVGSALVLSTRVRSWLRRAAFSRQEGQKSGRLAALLAQLDEVVSRYRQRPGTLALAFGMSFGVQACVIGSVWACATALSAGTAAGTTLSAEGTGAFMRSLADLGLGAYCTLVPVIMIVSAVPIAPAGWGVGETAFLHAFGMIGVAAPLAVSLSLTYRLTATLVSLLGGVFLVLDRQSHPARSPAQEPDPTP